MNDEETAQLLDDTEDWFVGNGMPHFIDDFTASEDVWTRAIGFLSIVFFSELFLTFGDSVSGWAQVGAVAAGLAVVVLAVAAVNRIRGRRAFQRPNEIGFGELALFVLIPPVLALIGGHNSNAGFVGVVAFNIAVLLLTYVVVSWGLFPMARWGLIAMSKHVGQVLQLLGRVLPLMLLFSAFLFLNAEIWQVANDMSWTLYAILLGSLATIAVFFLFGAMPAAIKELRWFDTWEEVHEACEGTPLEAVDTSGFDGAPKRVPLHPAAKRNLTVRLVVGMAAQVMLVTLLIFGFYIVFGLLTVREDTALQWTTLSELDSVLLGSFNLGPDRIVLTELHLVVAGIVAAFSGLQFAVSLVTDRAYRDEFVADSNAEVREALAVRAVYLRLRS